MVILTSQPVPGRIILALVSAAFSECEIHIDFKAAQTYEQSLAESSSGPLTTDKIGRR